MSDTVLVAIISLVGSVITALIGALVSITTSEKKVGCRSVIISVGAFGIIGLTVTGILAFVIISANNSPAIPTTTNVVNHEPVSAPPNTLRTDEQSTNSPPQPNANPPRQVTPINTQGLQEDVENWIRNWVKAPDDSALWPEFYEGEALDMVRQTHDDFVAARVMVKEDETNIVSDIDVRINSNGTSATALLTVETNGSLVGNGKCIRLSNVRVSYTVFLRRTSGSWIIYKYSSVNLNEPTTIAC